MTESTIGIYVHIPFCVKKCPYCSFNSYEVSNLPEDSYIDALLKELALITQEIPGLSERLPETVYLGGGTPSLISPEGIERIIKGILSYFGHNNRPEVTLEVNPGTVSYNRLRLLREAGINRLSIGVQSFSERGLKSLGRIHTAGDALNCYEYSRKAGFKNIGIDLISCIPGQTISEWMSGLDTVLSLRPEHVSAYSLTIEEGTPFFTLQKGGDLAVPHEEDQVQMIGLTIDRLTSAGYIHYEISNYALEGFESKHNNRYWNSMDYIGLGAGAHSYLSDQLANQLTNPLAKDSGMRWWNEVNPDKYIRSVNPGGRSIAGMESLTKEEAVTEGIFLGLRKINGIDCDWFQKRFHLSLMETRAPAITRLRQEGLLSEEGNRLRLTRQGLMLAETVITALI